MSIDVMHADADEVLARNRELRVSTARLRAAVTATLDASRRTREDIAACRLRSPLRRLLRVARGGSDAEPPKTSLPTCMKCQQPIEPDDLFVRRFHRYRLVHLVCWSAEPWSNDGRDDGGPGDGDGDGAALRRAAKKPAATAALPQSDALDAEPSA